MDFSQIINVQKNDNNKCVVFSIFAGNFSKRSDGNYDDFIDYIDKAMNTCVTTSKKLYNTRNCIVCRFKKNIHQKYGYWYVQKINTFL